MRILNTSVLTLAILWLGGVLLAQESTGNVDRLAYGEVAGPPIFSAWDGSLYSGVTDFRNQAASMTESAARAQGDFVKYEVVGHETARSVSINFAEFDLGLSSYVAVMGYVADAEHVQWFDHQAMLAAQGKTDVFDGPFVEVVLFATADDQDAFYEISSIDVMR